MSASEPVSPPDQRAFDVDTSTARFLAGVARGMWRVDGVEWPLVDVSVRAASRPGAPDWFTLRCDFANYPVDAPTATPWDPDRNAKLQASRRPKGDDVGVVFRSDWEDGRALYAAYDRVALNSHQNWLAEHPRTAWDATRDITWWLTRIWELLNDDDYQGI